MRADSKTVLISATTPLMDGAERFVRSLISVAPGVSAAYFSHFLAYHNRFHNTIHIIYQNCVSEIIWALFRIINIFPKMRNRNTGKGRRMSTFRPV